jgi:protein-tyrosine phosphatase
MLERVLYITVRLVLLSIFFIYMTVIALSYFDFFEPYLYPLRFIRGEAPRASEHIILGPYPRYEELERLKKSFGVKIVVSLLNVKLPQEKALYEREKINSEKLGLEVVNYPMGYLYLESESNEELIKRCVAFLRQNRDRTVYIHCYLGRHRTGFVRKRLAEAGLIDTKRKNLTVKRVL